MEASRLRKKLDYANPRARQAGKGRRFSEENSFVERERKYGSFEGLDETRSVLC